jgi:hypothetical protein
VQGIANAAYLEGFPFPALLRVAPYWLVKTLLNASRSASSTTLLQAM